MSFRILFILIAFFLPTFAMGFEDYNYSFINAGLGYNQQSQGVESIDGTAWYINAAYRLSSSPLILNAGYAYSQVDRGELADNTAIKSNAYFAGFSLLIQPTERFHILPALSSGSLINRLVEDTNEAKERTTVYSGSISARYHLERGLWLYSGYIHQEYEEKTDAQTNLFTAGAEYQVDKSWGLGLGYKGNSDQYSTHLFVKWFL
ncbi:hypothetical protein [uncultured Endozoicomonas sp.]|uniref:hypothetical protein n=1 Tax=uncultured Endozoicomonas sp. TaxID=432652 RepID=UPI0026188282|nr:hypothetical protein [uncultured Endozoicomonas sp.]